MDEYQEGEGIQCYSSELILILKNVLAGEDV